MRDITKASSICADFVQAVQAHDCKLLNKPKFHLLLHLPQYMKDFGRTASFNSER